MSEQLLTTWAEYQSAIDSALNAAQAEVCIFDPDLMQLRLDSPQRAGKLQRFLRADSRHGARIALQRTDHLMRDFPRLLALLREHPAQLHIVEVPEHLGTLRDCLLLADTRQGLRRFDFEQARSKVWLDEPEILATWRQRFEAIWNEGGRPISATILGL